MGALKIKMKIDNRIGKLKYWRRLINPFELVAFTLRYRRHGLRLQLVRSPLERLFMNHIKCRYRNFDPHKHIWQVICIQTVHDCTGTCWFCPNRTLTRTKTRMGIEIFKDIINELRELDYRDAILLHLQCDPFIDSRIEEFTAIASSWCPQASIFLSTNGLVLTECKYHNIMQWPNVDLIVNDYTANQGVLTKVRSWHITRDEQRRSRFVYKPEPDNITNMGGNMPSKFRLSLQQSCILPFKEIAITASGECVLCCSDWQKKHVMGDIKTNSLMDIWCGGAFKAVRAKLVNNIREGLCAKCDHMGYRPKMRSVDITAFPQIIRYPSRKIPYLLGNEKVAENPKAERAKID